MSEERFEQYNEVLNALVAESINCSPESWNDGKLTIDCDGSAINYKLKNGNDENTAQLSGELRQLCEELYVTMRQNGDAWGQSVVSYFRKDDTWGFSVNFKYDDDIDISSNSTSSKINKPWWKLW